YHEGDIVLWDSQLLQWSDSTPGNVQPPDSSKWTDVGDAVLSTQGLAARVTQNEQDIVEIDGNVTAISTSINAIESAWRESDDGTGALEGALNGWDTR
ncbi:hypothetical protein, partial [Vibrio parahaemolyticus]|uniref:hypothetical protein n=1 Tax=Vibrio parahaemolyticus TaxID=670 RepID=UPI001378C45A